MSDGKIPNGRVQRARRTSWAYYRGIWRCRRFKDDIDSQELVLPLLVTSFVTGVRTRQYWREKNLTLIYMAGP